MAEGRWYRDRTVMAVIGLVAGLVAGAVTWRVMSRRDMNWVWGDRQPIVAGVMIGFGVAVLLGAVTPRLK